MPLSAILLLAFGLAMDAMAVAAARGVLVRRVRVRHVAQVAGLFGGFQALMPLLGWLVGSRVGHALQAWDHWLVFVVLGGIGAKMLWEARGPARPAATTSETQAFGWRVMLLLAVATSIDALAAGFTLPLLGAPLLVSVVAIGVTAAVLSALGLIIGHRLGAALGNRFEVVGGLVLIGLGTKTLLEHLTQAAS